MDAKQKMEQAEDEASAAWKQMCEAKESGDRKAERKAWREH